MEKTLSKGKEDLKKGENNREGLAGAAENEEEKEGLEEEVEEAEKEIAGKMFVQFPLDGGSRKMTAPLLQETPQRVAPAQENLEQEIGGTSETAETSEMQYLPRIPIDYEAIAAGRGDYQLPASSPEEEHLKEMQEQASDIVAPVLEQQRFLAQTNIPENPELKNSPKTMFEEDRMRLDVRQGVDFASQDFLERKRDLEEDYKKYKEGV